MDNNNLSRRDFLKKTGKAALAGSAALYFETLVGCATFPKETREDVDDIKWDCNPVLPMPKNGGIYIGTNKSGCLRNKQYHIASLFTEKYGKRPTFLAPGLGRRGSEDDGRIWRDDITEFFR